MKLSELSLDELEDMEEELRAKDEENDPYINYQKVEVYEAMHGKLEKVVKADETYKDYLNYLTKKLIFHLIHYGTYLKFEGEKSYYQAAHNLRKALRYDKKNPIAAYRLGFMAYRQNSYFQALIYLRQALDFQEFYKDEHFLLNKQQVMNAQLYLTNSALHMAKKSYDDMSAQTENIPVPLQHYEFSTLFTQLQQNDQYLENQAFVKITQEGKSRLSKEECDGIMDRDIENTIILYFNDRNIELAFDGYRSSIAPKRADILRHLLTKSNKENPSTSNHMQNYFIDSYIKGVANNTYTKAINRLKKDMSTREIPEVIQSDISSNRSEPAYYYDHSLPFIVMYRVDEELNI